MLLVGPFSSARVFCNTCMTRCNDMSDSDRGTPHLDTQHLAHSVQRNCDSLDCTHGLVCFNVQCVSVSKSRRNLDPTRPA